MGNRGTQAAELAAVQKVTVHLADDGATLLAQAVIRDASGAEKLAAAVRKLVDAWEKTAGPKHEIGVNVEGSRTVIRAKLPPGALDSALHGVVARASKMRPR
jgi:hypothetical protein